MGMDKLLWPLAGVPVLRRTLEAFLAAKSITAVVVVCPVERWHALGGVDSWKPITRVDGGASRQVSVAQGLAALAPQCGWVAVHDGARPLVAAADIDRCVVAAQDYRAVALARRATETMRRADEEDFSAEPVSREHLWCMETPQVFEATLLRDAYHHLASTGLFVTDEVAAVQAFGGRVKFLESQHPNLKITTRADLALAAALLAQLS